MPTTSILPEVRNRNEERSNSANVPRALQDFEKLKRKRAVSKSLAAIALIVVLLVAGGITVDLAAHHPTANQGVTTITLPGFCSSTSYPLALAWHSVSGSRVFTSWYNCGSSALYFTVEGSVSLNLDSKQNVSEELVQVEPVTLNPNANVTLVSSFAIYQQTVNSVTVYAVESSSPSVVLSQVYTYE